MSPVQAAVLGILQGLSEFLPISSSGHLKLVEALFGFEELERYLLFDIVCHIGTLFAILGAYFVQLRNMDRGYIRDLFLATLPLVPCTLLLGPIKKVMGRPELLGFFFMGTALILYLGHRFAKQEEPAYLVARRSKHAVLVGFAQTLALFPGLSRSGTTISALRVMGWDEEQAKQFAFLMAVPAILGSVVIGGVDYIRASEMYASVSAGAYLIGFITSLAASYGILQLFFKVIKLSSFLYFGYYCLALGLLSLYLLG